MGRQDIRIGKQITDIEEPSGLLHGKAAISKEKIKEGIEQPQTVLEITSLSSRAADAIVVHDRFTGRVFVVTEEFIDGILYDGFTPETEEELAAMRGLIRLSLREE